MTAAASESPTAGRVALVAGATGAVGAALVQKLLAHPAYTRVKVLVRRDYPATGAKLEVLRLPEEGPEALGAALAADDVFCCLGTTQKLAGSQAAFERVDYHLVLEVARAALAAGGQRFLVVSAVGASLKSPSFYSRVKARMEQAVLELPFASVQVVRPSLLLTGARPDSRPAEWLAQRAAPWLNALLVGPLAMYRAVPVEAVADALITLALRDPPGGPVHHLPLAA